MSLATYVVLALPSETLSGSSAGNATAALVCAYLSLDFLIILKWLLLLLLLLLAIIIYY